MTWLYRITPHLCFNRVRDGEGAGPSPSEECLMLQQFLRHLPAELAEVAVYYSVDQMSHEEIAGLLGVSRRTVGNRLEGIPLDVPRIREPGPGLPARVLTRRRTRRQSPLS